MYFNVSYIEKKPLVPDPDHQDAVPIEPSVLASAIPEPRSLMHHVLNNGCV